MKQTLSLLIILICAALFLSGCQAPTSTDPAKTHAPTVPTGLTTTSGNGLVTISWLPVASASGYNLYYSTSTGVTPSSGTKIAGVTSPCTKAGLANGTAYYFVVTAVNAGGESEPSTQVTSTPQVPVAGAPAGLLATPGNTQIALTWGSVSGASSYNIYYSTTPGVSRSTGTKISGATSPYTVTGLINGSTYYFVVTANNAGGESPASNQTSSTPVAPTPPAAPSSVVVAAGNSQATLSWPAVSGATSYNLYYSTTYGVSAATGTKVAGVTSPYTQTGLVNGTKYYFAVTAVNLGGESATSGQYSATPFYQSSQWVQSVAAASAASSFYGITRSLYGDLVVVGSISGTAPYSFGNNVQVTGPSANQSPVIVKYNSTGVVQWAQTPSASTSNCYFSRVASDSSGNIFAIGLLAGTGSVDFGNGVTATGTSVPVGVIVKYNVSGVAQWALTTTETLSGIASDGNGNVYVIGYTNNSLVLVKYSATGTVVWTDTAAIPNIAYYRSVTVDTSGSVYVVGDIWGAYSYSFGNGISAMGTNNNANVLLVKYDASGLAQWARTVTAGGNYSYFFGVTTDSSGNVYAAGSIYGNNSYTRESYSFGNTVTAAGANPQVSGNYSSGSNILLVKYDSAGTAQWARTDTVGTAECSFGGVTCDSTGNVYATGNLWGTSLFGFGDTVTAAGINANSYNPVIVKYSSLGVAQWAQTVTSGSAASGFGGGIVASSGALYIAGYITGSGTYGFGNGVTAAGAFGSGANAVLVSYMP